MPPARQNQVNDGEEVEHIDLREENLGAGSTQGPNSIAGGIRM